jgi:hypothetical protein
MIEPNETGRSAVDWMPNVIHAPAIAIVPGLRHAHRTEIIAEEWTAQLAASLLLKRHARTVLQEQEPNGGRDGAF